MQATLTLYRIRAILVLSLVSAMGLVRADPPEVLKNMGFLPPWIPYNEATPVSYDCKDCWRLTTEGPTQKGCIWDNSTVNFGSPIDVEATVLFGDSDGGADGICMVFAPNQGCGDSGFGIGANGIANAVIIEFDTWNNGAGCGDIPNDHCSIDINGDVCTPIFGPADLGNIEDGQPHTIRFVWDGSGAFQVFFDGNVILSGSYDFSGVFGGGDVYFGYTASTGGAVNEHIVCPDNIPIPGPVPPEFIQFDTLVCEGELNVVYSVDPVPNSTYNWYLPPGASLNGSGASISINWGATGGDVCVEVDNGCDVSDTTCVTVTVTPIPEAEIDPPAVQCAETYNLLDLTLVNLQPGETVTYHPTQGAAQAGVPALPDPPLVDQSGTYWLRIEAGDGCFQVLPVAIVLEFPEILVEQPDPVCAPSSVDLLTVNVIDVNGLNLVDFSFHFSESEAEGNVNPLNNTQISASGTYWVRAATLNGCFDVAPITVTILSVPVIDAVDPPVLCDVSAFDLSDVEVNELSGLNIGGYTLSFHLSRPFAEAGMPAIDPPVITQSGTYWVRAATNEGCFSVDSFNVEFLPSPSVEVQGPNEACPGELVELVFTFEGFGPYEVSYTLGGQTFQFLTNDNPHAEWVTAGDGVVMINSFQHSTPAGCPEEIGGPWTMSLIEAPEVSVPEVICNTGVYTVSFQLLNGDPGSWVVSGSPGLQTGPNFVSDTISSGQPFQFLIWDGNGCDTIELVGVENCDCQTEAGSFVESRADLCPGDTLKLQHAGDGFLDPNDIREFILYQGVPGSVGTIIAWQDQPVFPFDPATMQLDSTYFVMPWAGDSLNGQVDTTDLCLSLGKAIPVIWHKPPSIQLPERDTVCLSQSYVLQGPILGTAPFEVTYQIGSGQPSVQNATTTFFANLPTTQSTFLVVQAVTDAFCKSVTNDTFHLVVNTGPTASGFQFDCNGTNTEFTISFVIMGGDPSTYQVTGGAGNLVGNVFTSGPIPAGTNYSFTVTDQYNCKPYVVSGNYDCLCLSNPGTIQGGPFNICLGDTLNYNVFGAFEDSNDTLLWWLVSDPSDPAGTRLWQTPVKRLYFPGAPVQLGQLYYFVGVAGNAGSVGGVDTTDACLKFSVAVPVRFVGAPSIQGVTADPGTVFTCQDTLISLNVTASANGNLTYKWATSGGSIQGPSNQATIVAAGAGWYSVTVTESLAGCKDTIGIPLTQSAETPVVILASPGKLTCGSNQVILSSAGSSVGIPFIPSWTTTNGSIIAGAGSYSPTVDAPGTYVLTITHVQTNCSASASVEVLMDTIPPVASAGPDITVSCGQVLPILDGSASQPQGKVLFEWKGLSGTVTGPTFNAQVQAASIGTFVLLVANPDNGCTDSDTVQVFPGLDLQVGPMIIQDPLCHGDRTGSIEIQTVTGGSGTLTATVAGRSFNVPGKLEGLAAGNYTLQLKDAFGCSWDTTFTLSQPPPLTISLGFDIEIEAGDNALISPVLTGGAQPYASLEWTSGAQVLCANCLSLSGSFAEQTPVKLTVTDANGCQASDEMLVRVVIRKRIFVPNIFSPGKDGINDVFTLFGGDKVRIIRRFAVFDRWGNDIFLLENFEADGKQGWNGEYRGRLVDPAVFVWYAEVEFVDGSVELIKGDVHVLR